MRIVLSRKGFDQANGGYPSPILPDGTMISLPIPDSEKAKYRYQWNDIQTDIYLNSLIGDLFPPEYSDFNLHLDPDLNRNKSKRLDDWRPAFGQCNSALGHLNNQKVAENDLFLFFGWFRNVRKNAEGKWEYYGEHFHSLFGWLEIETKLTVRNLADIQAYPFLRDHPHSYYEMKNNAIYVAKKHSEIIEDANFGGGMFRFSENLRLSKKGCSRSVWLLPRYFDPRNKVNSKHALTYHKNMQAWSDDSDDSSHVILQSARIGQEFVIDTAYFPEVETWANNIIKQHFAE